MATTPMKWLFAGALLTVLVGCTVYVRSDPPPRRVVVVEERPAPPPPPPAPAAEIVVSEDDEVHYVVYREYFGCSDVEIYAYPHYRRYYGISDDDIYFITFVARRRGITFEACFHSYYYDCGRNYDRLVVTYNVPRASFFCSVNVGVTAYPPVYQRTYVAYQQNNVTNITIQNNEYVALVHMKVGVEYQGHPPTTFFAQVNANGGNTSKVIVSNREACGKGGVTATGAKVTVTAQRPWTMPPAQKQAWHDDHKAAVVQHETTFKTAHNDQVQKVQAQKKPAQPAQPGQPGKAPGQEGQAKDKDNKEKDKFQDKEHDPKTNQGQGATGPKPVAPGQGQAEGKTKSTDLKEGQGAQGQQKKDAELKGKNPPQEGKQAEGKQPPPPKQPPKDEKDKKDEKK